MKKHFFLQGAVLLTKAFAFLIFSSLFFSMEPKAQPVTDVLVSNGGGNYQSGILFGGYSKSPPACPTATLGSRTGNYSEELQNGDSSSEDYFKETSYTNNAPLNGVTTYDLVLIRKHILGIEYLNSPYKIIAADANKSNYISTIDIVIIRRLILFIDTEFENNTSWRFVPATFVFPTPSNPFSTYFPECLHVDLSAENAINNVDFIAIKVGDVDNSAMLCLPYFTDNESNLRDGHHINLKAIVDKKIVIEETILVDFWMDSPKELVSWEMGLRFDTRYLEFEEAVPGDLEGMNVSCFGATQASEGKLRALWVSPFALPISFEGGARPFKLRFKALRAIEDLTEVVFLDDSVLHGRAYESDGTANGFQLSFGEGSPLFTKPVPTRQAISVAAVPNPFTDELRVLVSVPEDDWLEVALFDINGRLVASWSGETDAGQREVVFSDTKAWGEGVFTFRVRTSTDSVTGKVAKQ